MDYPLLYKIGNLTGMILEIIGVIKLFQEIGQLNEIRKIDIGRRISHDRVSPKELDEIVDQINGSIKDWNTKNKESHDQNWVWFLLILVGFIIQLICVAAPFSNTVTDNKADQRATKNYYYKQK